MSSLRVLSQASFLAVLLWLTGCIGGKTPPSEFYLLEPIRGAEGGRSARAGDRLLIALAPVRIPQYVDRPQIVTATDRNAYRLNELHRWAERLDDNIARVLTQNLGVMVPADVVSANASNVAKQAEWRLSVDVLEFHVDPLGEARLGAQWRVVRGQDLVLSRKGSYHQPASSSDYRVMVSALNECLNRWSRDIAGGLRQLAGRH